MSKLNGTKNLLLSGLLLAGGVAAASAELPLVRSGETIAFLGDSITFHGTKNPMGYVNLVMEGLKRAGIEAKAVPAGVSGDTCRQMLARMDRDVIAKKPDVMCLSCGVNDAPNAIDNPGVPLDEYRTKIVAILDKAKAAGIRCVIFTATPVLEYPGCIQHEKLAPYNETLRTLAKERSLPLVEINIPMVEAAKLKPVPTDVKYLTVDGTHLNTRGNILMAACILRAFGVPGEQIKTAVDLWYDRPGGCETSVKVSLSLKEYTAFQETLKKRGFADEKAFVDSCVREAVKDAAKE